LLSFTPLIALSLAAGAPATVKSPCPTAGVEQLRIYEIFESNKVAFHDRFRDHGTRIMKRHGFEIVTMWETSLAGRTEFAYILRWPDEATMKAQWAAFLADEEWVRIKQEWAAVHGQAVGEIQDRTLKRTDYSPC
jgi:hypothetical protein